MRTAIIVDTTVFVLAMGVIVKLCIAMAQHGSLHLLSTLPEEFQYLAGLLF